MYRDDRNILAHSANLQYILPSVISFFFLNQDQLSQDLPGRFSQSFHHMKAFVMKLTHLNLFFYFLKGRCHGNQF